MVAHKARSSRNAAAGHGPGPDQARIADTRLPAIAGMVEAEVLPRLLASHQARQLADAAAAQAKLVVPDTNFVAGFAASLIAGNDGAVKAGVADLRAKGMTAEAICLRMLAPVARHLGEQWEADRCSFLEVTTATASLHGIMNELRPAFQNREVVGAFRRRMMLFSAPGEQHRFGLSMLAEFFRKDGWQVALPIGSTIRQITTLVTSRPTDAIGFSAGSDRHLDALSSCIAAIRAGSCNPDVVIMVGGPVFLERPELARSVGADATASCAEEAVVQAGILVEARRAASRSPARNQAATRNQAAVRRSGSKAGAEERSARRRTQLPSRSANTLTAACGQDASHAP